jgi:hypothetical protein
VTRIGKSEPKDRSDPCRRSEPIAPHKEVGMTKTEVMQGPVVTKYGMLDMQVCVPADWSDEQAVAFAETEYPSGTNGWRVRKAGDPDLSGDPERNPCALRVGCVHIVLDA